MVDCLVSAMRDSCVRRSEWICTTSEKAVNVRLRYMLKA